MEIAFNGCLRITHTSLLRIAKFETQEHDYVFKLSSIQAKFHCCLH